MNGVKDNSQKNYDKFLDPTASTFQKIKILRINKHLHSHSDTPILHQVVSFIQSLIILNHIKWYYCLK